jgi:hypothetical protein
MGIDTSKAVERLRSESRGRKRARSRSAAGRSEDGDEEMEDATPKKRIHSSKSRCVGGGTRSGAGGEEWDGFVVDTGSCAVKPCVCLTWCLHLLGSATTLAALTFLPSLKHECFV